jgi:ABC-type methionine transport system ATPase subunit
LPPGDRLRVAVARTLVRRPAALVLRGVDAALGADDAASLLGMLGRLVRSHRLIAVVSLASIELARTHAERVLVVAAGGLVPDTRERQPQAAPAARQLERVVR